MLTDESALEEVDSKVLKIPACFADLCLQAFTARQELIDWIKNLIETNVRTYIVGSTLKIKSIKKTRLIIEFLVFSIKI